MSEHSDDFLPEYVLGLLEPEPRRSIEEHLTGCPRCAARVSELGGALAPSPFQERSTPPPVAARPKLRLVAAEQHGRFEDLAERVARFFDVRFHRAVALLELIDDPACWTLGTTGVATFTVDAGARLEGALARMLRAAPGTKVALHRHHGGEHTLVLQGGLRDSSGRELHRGDTLFQPGGPEHSVEALPGEECICCVVTLGD
ncbi:MAG: cupin domain-containing protein [Myxococcaceae bacterium]